MVHIMKRFLIPLDVTCMHCFDFQLQLQLLMVHTLLFLCKTKHQKVDVSSYLCSTSFFVYSSLLFSRPLHLTIHEQVNCIYIGRCIHMSHTYACMCAYICMLYILNVYIHTYIYLFISPPRTAYLSFNVGGAGGGYTGNTILYFPPVPPYPTGMT